MVTSQIFIGVTLRNLRIENLGLRHGWAVYFCRLLLLILHSETLAAVDSGGFIQARLLFCTAAQTIFKINNLFFGKKTLILYFVQSLY